jgi:predicted SnoaL-like aldol condensation-catalyzing enzyme
MRLPSITGHFAALLIGLALVAGAPQTAHAQTTPAEAANKALVLEFWSTVFDAQDWTKAKDYIADDYIQHNPNVAGGLKGFTDFFSKIWPQPKAADAIVKTDFAAVLVDGDLVQLVIRRPRPEPADATKTYNSYWFDLFRVKDGKIVEHWDPALKPVRN